MTGPDDNRNDIRKIAVAFDPACSAPALLEAAAEIAASLGAELEALFVDDPDIIRLSGLPFGRIVSPYSGKTERLDAPALTLRRAGPAARSRAALQRLAQAYRFAYTVRELHGRAMREAAGETSAELLVVATFHGKFGGTRSVDEEALGLAATASRSVFFVSQYPVSVRRIALVADGGTTGGRAEQIARRIAGRYPEGGGQQVERIDIAGIDAVAAAARVRAVHPTLVVMGLEDAAMASELRDAFQHDTFSVLVLR
jgi:hypothetical protein